MFVPIIKVIPVKYSCLYRAAVFLSTSVRCHPSSAYEKQITKTWFQSVWFLFHFLSDEFSYQRCEKQKVICSLELKFPGRNGRYWRRFIQTNCPKRTWFVDVTRELLFLCADFCMYLFFTALIFECSTWPIELFYRWAHDDCVCAHLIHGSLYYALFPANYQTTVRRKAKEKKPLSGIFLL